MGLQDISVELADGHVFPEASVHGRFQPLHNDHVEYIMEAKKRCDYLWIGITKYEIDQLNPLGRHRERPEANPLTFFERVQIIKEALMDFKVSTANFGFLPFPIENPSALHSFLPVTIPCFTTICDDWNREKIRLLEDCGYQVIVLWERVPKRISGSRIREDIAAGGEMWHSLVPAATVRAIEKLNLQERIRMLLKKNNISAS